MNASLMTVVWLGENNKRYFSQSAFTALHISIQM